MCTYLSTSSGVGRDGVSRDGDTSYVRETTKKRDQQGNGKGLIIINNQPF